jgi:ribosomal protein L40E
MCAAERRPALKKTCPRCKRRVSERAARCRHCGYRFPEKSSPWAAGPALGAGFPLVMMGVLTLFVAGSSPALVVVAAGMVFVGLLLFFHPR